MLKRAVFSFIILLTLRAFAQNSAVTFERNGYQHKMRNQGDTSTCWLHSAVQMIEQAGSTHFSIDALAIAEVRSRALMRYLGHETPWDGGAGPTRPFALALEHGLVPECVWNRNSVIIRNYAQIFQNIDVLLEQHLIDQKEFLGAVDRIIQNYTGELPPEIFEFDGQQTSAVALARQVIAAGKNDTPVSIGYDFRPVLYDDSVYGRLPIMAWTYVASKNAELTKITDIIHKQVIHTDAKTAWNIAIEIFRAKRPVAFTFIWGDHQKKTVLKLNEKKQYVAVRPSTKNTYVSSHLVLITGLQIQDGEVVALEVLDPLATSIESAYRIVTRNFFDTHGKTVHEVQPMGCNQLLGGA